MNKRILILGFIIIIFIGILLSNFVFYDKYKMPKNAEIVITDEKFDVYKEKLKMSDLIVSDNVDILTEDLDVDTQTVGEHTVTIEYKYKSKIKKYKYDIKYTVEDNVDPIFIKAPATTKTFFVNEGKMENLKEKISYADNYDPKPIFEIEGDIDFSEVGVYNLKYVLTDSSKNEVKKDLKVTIKERPVATPKDDEKQEEKEEPEEEEDKSIKFEDHIAKYKSRNTMVGIDISKWQGEVDFEKVKEAGCEFVIIRMGVMKDKDTPLVLDKTYKTNMANAKKAGLKVGVYVYVESNTTELAIENAEFVIENLDGMKLDFPVAFDFENWTGFHKLEINLHRLNEMYDAFSETLEEAGYDTMLYASEYYLNNVWLDLKDYDLWVAKYSEKMPSVKDKEYKLWQVADTGKLEGIDAPVDLDIFYK